MIEMARAKLKSPYSIISRRPIFKDTRLVADEQISLTGKMDSDSIFGPAGLTYFPSPGDPLSDFLSAELAASRDGLILEAAAKNWQEGRIPNYMRLRTMDHEGRQVGYLAEITFLRLTDGQSTDFHTRFTRLHEKKVTRFSMYSVLEQCGLTDLRAGRTQVDVGVPPDFLGHLLRGTEQPRRTGHIQERLVD